MAPPFAPLVGDDPTFMNTPGDIATAKAAGSASQQPMNKVIPPELSSMEDRLKAQGSGTSWVTTTLAILGAAKGDFRGVMQLEEQKRRTALAKSMVPEITKVNDLTNNGKWEEASFYVNQLANSYGQRADYLVPYFQQMQANIQKKQEGWNNLKGVYEYYRDRIPEGSARYGMVESLRKAVESRSQISETTLQGIMTREAPHIQYLDNRMIAVDPTTLQMTSQNMPQMYNDKDFNNVIGLKTATAAGLTPQGMADLFNGRIVKASDKSIIEPNSEKADLIKAHYISQQPIEARLKLMQNLKLESPLIAQLVAQGASTEDIALGNFGKGGADMDRALEGQAERLKRQTIATREGVLEVEPVTGPVLNLDPTSPGYLSEITRPVTSKEITESRGKLGKPQPETVAMIRKTQAAIEGLNTASEMLKEGSLPQTRGSRLASGAIQRLSGYINYPLTSEVENRQVVKSILNTAIEQIENTAIASPGTLRGGDREDIAKLKAFSAGDFKSEKDVLSSIERTKSRLSNMTNMMINQPGAAVKPKTPAGVIAPLIPPKGGTSQGQSKGIDPDLEKEIDRVEGIARQSNTGSGGVRVIIPVQSPTQPVTPVQGTQQPKGYSEEDEAAKAMARRQQRRR